MTTMSSLKLYNVTLDTPPSTSMMMSFIIIIIIIIVIIIIIIIIIIISHCYYFFLFNLNIALLWTAISKRTTRERLKKIKTPMVKRK